MASRPRSVAADLRAGGTMTHRRAFCPFRPLRRLLLFLFLFLCAEGCGKEAVRVEKAPSPSWTCDTPADEAMKRHEYLEAILLHERFLERSPENALALYHLGYAYGRTGGHTKEIFYYEEAVRRGFETGQIYFNMGMAYGELGQSAKAISSFHKAIEANPRSSEYYYGLAKAYRGVEGAFDFAEGAFLKAIDIDPAFIDARFDLSLLYADAGRFRKAQTQLRRILEIDPNHREARELLQKLASE